MSIAHEGTSLPIQKVCLPIDWKNTTALFHYDITADENLSGIQPIVSPPSVYTLRPIEGRFGGAIAVEEGTTNLAPYTDYSNRTYNTCYDIGGWGGDTADVYYYPDGGYNNLPYKKMIKKTGGTGGSFKNEHGYFTIENNTTYVVSCYMKASRNVDVGNLALDLNRDSDNAYRSGPSIVLTTEWKRYSWVYNAGADHAGTQYHSRQIIYVDAELPLEVYWCGFQVEKKSFPTSYVNGTRPNGFLEYPASMVDVRQGTFSCWAKTVATTGTRYLFFQWSTTGSGASHFGLQMTSTGAMTVSYGTQTFTSPSTYSDGKWHHYAMTWKDGTNEVYLYVDGVKVAQAAGIATIEDTGGRKHGSIPLGHRGWTYRDDWWNGLIDEVRWDKVAQPPEVIQAWYQSQAPFFPKGIHKQFL